MDVKHQLERVIRLFSTSYWSDGFLAKLDPGDRGLAPVVRCDLDGADNATFQLVAGIFLLQTPELCAYVCGYVRACVHSCVYDGYGIVCIEYSWRFGRIP